jgi:hypothetical protein
MKSVNNKNKNENIYYVYAYLDPRKIGNYVYGKFNFEYEPFYVGYGYYRRYLGHLYKSNWKQCKNKLKVNKIKKIIKETGQNPIIIKYNDKLKQTEAIILENEMIKIIGRINLKTGPLTNMTDGGEGMVNRVISDKERKERSERMKGSKNPNYGGMREETKIKMRLNHADFKGQKNPNFGNGEKVKGSKNGMFAKKHTNDSKIKMSQNKSRYFYEVVMSDGKIFSNISPFEIKIKLNLEKFNPDFNGKNNCKYKGNIIKRFIKEEK